MVTVFRRSTTEILAGIGAASAVFAFAAWTLSSNWSGNQSRAISTEQAPGSTVSGLELLRTQVRSHPKDWRWSLLLARAQHLQGDQDGALRTLRPLQRLHPNQPEVLALGGLLALESDRGVELIKSLSERFGVTASDERLRLGLLLADLQRLSGKPEEASDLYRTLIEDNPGKPEPLLALALLRKDQGDGAEAIALLRKALAMTKNLTDIGTDLQTLELRWALEASRNGPASSGLKAVQTP